MWGLIRASAASARCSLKSREALDIARLLNDMMYCRRSFEECLAKLGNIEILRTFCGGTPQFRKPVPNEETAFALRILSELENALLSGDHGEAEGICNALTQLPKLSELYDTETVESFNRSFIDSLNEKYASKLIRLSLIKR